MAKQVEVGSKTVGQPTAEEGSAPSSPTKRSSLVESIITKAPLHIMYAATWAYVASFYACLGFIFGFAFEKSDVFAPVSIRGQFTFEHWAMFKMFFAALSASCFSWCLARKITPIRFALVRAAFLGEDGEDVVGQNLRGAMMGAGILGAGMAIAAACPGMVTVQVGSGVATAWITILGGLAGALTYGFLDPSLAAWSAKSKSLVGSADAKFGLNYNYLLIGLGLGCAAAAVVLELVVPFKDELSPPIPDTNSIFSMKRWPPAISGAIIGGLNLPLITLGPFPRSLGCSSAYYTVVSQWLLVSPQCQAKYQNLESMRKGVNNWWQVFFVGTAVLGAWVSAETTNSIGRAPGVAWYEAFIGGFMMLFGARQAGGCTSGHG